MATGNGEHVALVERLGSNDPHARGLIRGAVLGISLMATVTTGALAVVGRDFLHQLDAQGAQLANQGAKMEALRDFMIAYGEHSKLLDTQIQRINGDFETSRVENQRRMDQAIDRIAHLEGKFSATLVK